MDPITPARSATLNYYYNHKTYCNVLRVISNANAGKTKPRPATLQYWGIVKDANGKFYLPKERADVLKSQVAA